MTLGEIFYLYELKPKRQHVERNILGIGMRSTEKGKFFQKDQFPSIKKNKYDC